MQTIDPFINQSRGGPGEFWDRIHLFVNTIFIRISVTDPGPGNPIAPHLGPAKTTTGLMLNIWELQPPPPFWPRKNGVSGESNYIQPLGPVKTGEMF